MRRRSLALTSLLFAACGSPGPTTGPAVLVASVVLDYDLGFFGGLSGLDVGPDGRDVTLLLDSGLLIRGLLNRGADGTLKGLRHWQLIPIREPVDLDLGDQGLDAEGIAVTDAGTFVSLERIHAVWRVNPATGWVAERLPRDPAFDALQENSSFEALAADAAGALYTLPERSGGRRRPFPVWRHADGTWSRAFDMSRRGGFLAVGADFGPDGKFYLLERRILLPFGFATRVRRFTLDDGRVANEEVLLESSPGTHDNLEGLAVWEDADGAIRLTMVSDDNFFPLQETQIVEYRLPPPLDTPAAARYKPSSP